MFLKSFSSRLSVCRNYLLSGTNTIHIGSRVLLNRSNGYSSIISKRKLDLLQCQVIAVKCQVHRHYSRGLLDGDISDLQNAQKEKDLSKLSSLFPNPRVTLYELAAKCPSSVFDIHYKQSVVTPKGGRKKAVQNDWICTYNFVWPQKIKFEGSAISKRQAAEKAAIQALHFLYANKRIDDKGCPVFDKTVIEELNSSMQEPIKASISEASMERIENIWQYYNSEIKDIYNTTFEAAKRRVIAVPSEVTMDSTIDDNEELSDDGIDSTSNEATDLSEARTLVHPVYGRQITPPTRTALDRRKRQLLKAFEYYDEHRTPLPIDDYSDRIAATVSSSRVSLLVGAAGCGKSSRAPVETLRGSGDATVLVAGPRRVAAIGLARRVASELGEQVGETVGYQVRLDSKPPRPPTGSILYCTSGILLRRLQTNPGLHGCTHVLVDEAHERDVNTDLSLLLLKRAVHLNPELRVVVMSATLDTEVFTKYFDSCPVLEVPGRTFPVQTSYLDDIRQKYNLELSSTWENCRKEDAKPFVNCQEVAEVIKAVDRTEPEGAILVFLPGWAEIKQVKMLLDQSYADSTHLILPIHSRLSTTDQALMFSRPLPGVRKIVLATNIAETSVTIPDVVFVVDSGAHKENRLMEGTGTASLETVWVSQAGARQRAGRAGRVQPGHCYKLYTNEKENDFAPFTTPEILRVPLEQTVLDCKTYAPDDKVESFLSQLPEPPTQKAIQLAVADLIDLGALTDSEQLTRLGSILSSLTVHPRLGVCLLWAPVVGNCVAAAACIAHAHHLEVFADAADRRDEIREIKREFSDSSDHVALYWIQEEYERVLREKGGKAADAWCGRYGIRRDRLDYVRSISNLYLEQLLSTPLVQPSPDVEELNRFSGVDELMAAVLLCGPNQLLMTKAKVRTKGKLMADVKLVTSKGDRAHISSESVNHRAKRSRVALFAHCGGFHSRERRALVVRLTTRLPPGAVLTLAPGSLHKDRIDDDTTELYLPRHKLKIQVPARQADHIIKVREMFSNTFQYYVERNPKEVSYEENTMVSRFKVKLVKAIGRLLVEAERDLKNASDGVNLNK